MLSREDNEKLTRVGPGTVMGDLLRQYWQPVLFSWELEADGAPERVRLLGEDLVAFRDTSGRIGLVGNNCPHRGASLFFGRNEEEGLRCVYHGWKFDLNGACVDMPNEPPESNFKHKINHVAYPCVERAGMIWAYLGPRLPRRGTSPRATEDVGSPPLPHFEWMDLPAEHMYGSKRVQYSNWVQAMEGDIDQSHVSFVHSRLNLDGESRNAASFPGSGPRRNVDEIRMMDKHPRFEVVETDYGICIGAGREAPDDQRYWRVTQHLMPFHTMTGPYGEDPMRPLTDTEVERFRNRGSVWNVSPEHRTPESSLPYGRWRPECGLDNDFHIDREEQRTRTFSGIPEFWAQDAAPQLSMGPIFDRSREHLGTTDLAIISVRRRLLNAARLLRERGTVPEEVSEPNAYMVRSDALLLPKDESWFAATEGRRQAVPGVNPACL